MIAWQVRAAINVGYLAPRKPLYHAPMHNRLEQQLDGRDG
jgi:hypothetical protein